jgi:hypothetical protein
MPNVLQELMRHESINTTMKYYVGQNAKRTASILWEAHRAQPSGDTVENSRHSTLETKAPAG